MAKVYVIQIPRYRDRVTGEWMKRDVDLSDAENYGEVVELFDGNARPFFPENVIEELYEKLADYGDSDWLIQMGNPILLSMAAVVASNVNDGAVNFLQWSGAEQRYIAVKAFFED